MSDCKPRKFTSQHVQIQTAISCRNLSVHQTLKEHPVYSQTPLDELLTDIENFSYETMLPQMQKIQQTISQPLVN